MIWTYVGSTCVPEEDSIGKYETPGGRFRHKDPNIEEIRGSYNVTAVPQVPISDTRVISFGWNVLEVVYRCQAQGDRVRAELIRVNDRYGSMTSVALFDSDAFGKSKNEQKRHIDIDSRRRRVHGFQDGAYFIRIRVNRTDARNHPDIAIVRLRYEP